MACSVFNIQVVLPVLFINSLVGTMGKYNTGEIEEYLKQVIVSRLNDYLGKIWTAFSTCAENIRDGLSLIG